MLVSFSCLKAFFPSVTWYVLFCLPPVGAIASERYQQLIRYGLMSLAIAGYPAALSAK